MSLPNGRRESGSDTASPLTIEVNGNAHAVSAASGTPLLDFLRDHLALTGTKEACGRGECGACTVLIDGRPILACIRMVEEVTGAVTTIEGLATQATDLREAFADHGAFQCGFCTSGQIVRAVALLEEPWPEHLPSFEKFIRHAMSGNICRCTGYVGIVDAIASVAQARGKIQRGAA